VKISKKPPRYKKDHSIYFLTFCTFKRHPYLHRNGIPEMLIENLKIYSDRIDELIAYTIMTDHIHLLISVKIVSDLSIFLRDFKKWTSLEIRRILKIEDRHIWQRGTMDHCIRWSWENKDFDNHLYYLLSNSFKHLHIQPKDFPYHNFWEFVKKGWVEEDFYAVDDIEVPRFYEL
jgi:REP element-mobilizing transposase RayT